MDHPGPIARCVRDLAILLQAIAGPDPYDPTCCTVPVPNLLAPLEQELPPPRLGRLRGLFDELAEPVMRKQVETSLQAFRQAGGQIIEVALPAGFAEVLSRHRTVMAVE